MSNKQIKKFQAKLGIILMYKIIAGPPGIIIYIVSAAGTGCCTATIIAGERSNVRISWRRYLNTYYKFFIAIFNYSRIV